jgi:hypothetical protein
VSRPSRIRLGLLAATALLAGGLAPGAARASSGTPPCGPQGTFDPAAFPAMPLVDNRWLPLTPGTQLVYDGVTNRNGTPIPHRVIFTVTDVTKVIAGVRSVVVWDVDQSDGRVAESELAFFAQDVHGTVWNVGEYPETFRRNGEFDGAPDTWIAGVAGALPGIHMLTRPRMDLAYLQGFSPDIGFFDCAEPVAKHRPVCTPLDCFNRTLVTNEWSPLEPDGGRQVKVHAQGVGIVSISALDDPEGETLALVGLVHLSGDALAAVRDETLRLDRRAYRFAADVYRDTPPAE